MAVSLLVLARLVGCHRDQFRAWRKLGAPADLDLRAWHRWLTETRRWNYAATLAKAIGEDAADPAPAGDGAPAAPKDPSADTMSEVDASSARIAEVFHRPTVAA